MGAGAVALAASYLIRYSLGGVFLPELAVNALVTQTPGTVESVLVTNLQSLAKYSAFTGAIAINLLLYGFLAYFMTAVGRRTSYADRVPIYSLVAYAVTLGLTVVFLELTQVLSTPQSIPSVIIALLPSQFLFGFTLGAADKFMPIQKGVICEPMAPGRQPGKRFDRKRRLLIEAGVATAVGGVLLYYGVNLLFPKPTIIQGSDESTLYSQEVTPNSKFYRVDVNIFPPSVDTNSWSLRVMGLVGNPLTLNYAQLTGMNSVQQYNTLECVSNDIGGDLISTAKWTGVKLKDVLQAAGVQSDATYVIFGAADGYDVGIPLERALLDGTILAYQMNDAPLPQEHGYPIRAIVPGYYGMMNCKWVTTINVVNYVHQGYWQQRGWANEAQYQTGSSIVTPGISQIDDRFGIPGGSQLSLGQTPIAGIAFAGDRGIEKVEVSTDGGNTWVPASLKEPLSGYTWVFWRTEWNPPTAGQYKIEVRATDKTGAVQTAIMTDPFPSGATGYHIVNVAVTSS